MQPFRQQTETDCCQHVMYHPQARGSRHYWLSLALSFNIGAIVALLITNIVFPWCVNVAAMEPASVLDIAHVVAIGEQSRSGC